MRRLAGITIASFTTLALAGVVGSSPFDVGGDEPSQELDATIIIEKELPDEYDAELPPSWTFRIDSVNCGDAIEPPDHGSRVETLIVDVDAEGGESEEITVNTQFFFGVGAQCTYRIIELPVDGWEPVSPASGVAEVTPDFDATVRVQFSNRPTTPTTTVPETTTTVADTTTTVADTTTTVADTTTTVAAPTTVPPTTAGTVAPELPATGSSNVLTGLLAGLLVLGGLGALAVSRRS